MILHIQLIDSAENRQQLLHFIRNKKIQIAGNAKLNIYGLLSCKSGKRMNAQSRVFFSSINEARQYGYRPCGHCLNSAYQNWKSENNQRLLQR